MASSLPPAFVDDEPVPHVSFPSTWRTRAVAYDIQTETRPLAFLDASTQSVTTADGGCQTDDLEAAAMDDSVLSFGGWEPPHDVVSFLLRTGPLMESQLRRNDDSHAFDDYTIAAADEDEEVHKLHTLTVTWEQPVDDTEAADEHPGGVRRVGAPAPRPSAGAGAGAGSALGSGLSVKPVGVTLPCTDVSWSATGSLLFASFGRLDHSSWCTHRSGLAAWNLFKRDFDGSKPDYVLDTTSCLMCIACHPEKPSVVVGGTYNGEVVVWDTNNDEPLVAISRIDDYLHREPISQVCWFYDIFQREYLIASVSGDGKVLFWTLANDLRYPVQGFRLMPATKRKGESRAKRILAGGTALSFTHEGKLSSSFVVGSEGGGVYRCLLRHRGGAATAGGSVALSTIKTTIPWNQHALLSVSRMPTGDRTKVIRHVERFAREKSIREVSVATIYDAKPEGNTMFPNPVDFKYQPHVGPVQAIDTSPFHRNLFLSVGADGRIGIFSVLQAQPVLTLEPSSDAGPLYTGSFSRVRPLVFAVAGASGTVYLYDLQRNTSAPVEELSVLDKDHVAGFTKPPAVLSTSFNPVQRKLLAAGDAAGNVHVWRLGWRMSIEQSRERVQLGKFMGVSETA